MPEQARRRRPPCTQPPLLPADGRARERLPGGLLPALALCDAAAHALVRGDLGDDSAQALCASLAEHAPGLVVLDLSGNKLTAVPPAVCDIVSLQALDLSHNAITELPPELLRLTKLTKLDLASNPALRDVARIGQQKGVAGIFDYLRDLRDAPRPCFSLKLLLAGPSMAGKSSMLQSLLRKDKTLRTPDERTIGLEIERLVLTDPSGRAVGGIVFLAYDAGGHDEYMEIHQTFFTENTLFVLVWNLAPRPAEGQDTAALTAQMNLGSALLNQGKYVEAEAIYHENLARKERKFGSEHVDTLSWLVTFR